MFRRTILLTLLSTGVWSVSLTTAFADAIVLNENSANPIALPVSPVTAGTLLLCDQGDMVLDPSKTGKPGVYACGIFNTGFPVKLHVPSDSIVFSNPAMGISQAFFCSNIDSAIVTGDTGDTCKAGPAMTGSFAILEQGVENVFESTPYNPARGQPGFGMMGTSLASYTLISDANVPPRVPEPSSLLLLGSGMCAFVFRVLRKSR